MSIISGGRYARGLQKTLGVKGETVIPDLDSALQADFSVSDAESSPDKGFLFGWRRYAGQLSIAANAGLQSVGGIQNPANSGVIAIIERCRLRATVTAADIMEIFVGNGYVISGHASPKDFRQAEFTARSTKFTSLCFFSALNPGAITGTLLGDVPCDFSDATRQTFEMITERTQHPVLPGDDWFATTPVVNVGLRGIIEWRERALDPSELTG